MSRYRGRWLKCRADRHINDSGWRARGTWYAVSARERRARLDG
ncbi:MAG: hypothetical protein JWO77_1486 [Ilumatobacteraceae bacterium]|nr:hypothetical protein [Ilumatobacteraceae bacterium]